MKLYEENILDYLDKLGSKMPSPGGGSVAGLNGALSVALLQMVVNLSKGKKGLEKFDSLYDEIMGDINPFKSYFVKQIDEDAHAFDKVIEALKLPKDSREEILFRKNKIQEGYRFALDVSMKCCEKSLEFMYIIEKMVDISNKNLISDVFASVNQLKSCFNLAMVNVKINLNYIKDICYKKSVVEKNKYLIELFEDREKNIEKRIINILETS